ncbi:hypothetical protein F4677DRAFT_461473 [Hypoxylon crocopeplum]|nr:hypothetical protein F4677DRAFT_461473 [Hypoxylon crocopeplum]
MKVNAIFGTVAVFCGVSAALPAMPASEQSTAISRSSAEDIGLTSRINVVPQELETRNNQQVRVFWRRQGTKMIIRVVGLLTPGWRSAGGIIDSLQSVPEVSTAISSTIRSGLINGANGIQGAIAWVYGTFTPTYTNVGQDSSVGVDIGTTSALSNIADQQILNNVVQLLQSYGLNVPAPQQDDSLNLPQKRDLDALNARQLSNGAQQFCQSPNTEILQVFGNGNPSTSLSYGTACP